MSTKHQQNIWKILFDTWDKIFGDVEEYFVTCSWMNDILWMKMLMTIENGRTFS
jgi:hypothetical protein